jgi:hypothetical protein
VSDNEKVYELFHGDGGHGGPYTLEEAIEAGKRLAVGRVQRGAPSAYERVFRGTTAKEPTKIIQANRCMHCAEIHVCVS